MGDPRAAAKENLTVVDQVVVVSKRKASDVAHSQDAKRERLYS